MLPISKIRAALLALICLVGFAHARAQQQAQSLYANPVIAGDYPDPSVIRVGEDYWATSTSGEWAPEFPILHSRDLVHWQVVGAVFQERPAWAAANFWAPEISFYRGRYYVYYTARKRGGPLCVAVAASEKASGPYTDYGPLVCQEVGSIDAMMTTDEGGKPYLIWKEDGNSRNQPTPIWAQPLSDDGTKLTGSKKQLIRNDPQSWEGGVVEGAFILRRGDWFYLFYSGNACCGRRCNYALGVARSRKLLGPWEKNPANPILAENQTWQCPGHGSIVTDERGRFFLLYHAYKRSEDAFYIGREALLDEVTWDEKGWPTINRGAGPTARAPLPLKSEAVESKLSFTDEFDEAALSPGWQWPQSNKPSIRIEGGRLALTSTSARSDDVLGAVLSRPSTTGNYVATTLINLRALKAGALAGLSAYSWREDAVGIAAGGNEILVYVREKNRQQVVKRARTPQAALLYLRMKVKDGARYQFSYSEDGVVWQILASDVNAQFIEGARVALTVGGVRDASAGFEMLRITPLP